MKLFKYILAPIVFISLVSCSSMQVNVPDNDELLRIHTEQNGRACVRQTDIRGFGILDDDVISIDARGRNSYYLVTTMYRCHSLQTSFSAGFLGDFSELCGGGFDKIITADETCPIKSIFTFNSRQAAFDAFEQVEQTRAKLREEAKQARK